MRRDWPDEWQAEIRGLQTQLAGERSKLVQERRRTDIVREESKVTPPPLAPFGVIVGTVLLLPVILSEPPKL